MSNAVAAHHVSVTLNTVAAVKSVSLSIPHGSFVGVLGPNGSGKSSLLRALYRAVGLTEGTVWLDGTDIWQLDPTAVARQIAVVAQEEHIGFEYTTFEVVMMGRTPYTQGFARTRLQDEQLVAESLTAVGMARLAERQFDEMSGGERQRALIARALVQQSAVLILDEPTNHLDIHFQLDVLRRVKALNLTTIAALHDMNLASAWCDYVYVMDRGEIAAAGVPAEVLTPELIARVFAVKATPFVHPKTGTYQLLFDPLDEVV